MWITLEETSEGCCASPCLVRQLQRIKELSAKSGNLNLIPSIPQCTDPTPAPRPLTSTCLLHAPRPQNKYTECFKDMLYHQCTSQHRRLLFHYIDEYGQKSKRWLKDGIKYEDIVRIFYQHYQFVLKQVSLCSLGWFSTHGPQCFL